MAHVIGEQKEFRQVVYFEGLQLRDISKSAHLCKYFQQGPPLAINY